MKELTDENRAKIAAELENKHGPAIEAISSELYMEKPRVIGIALAYLNCGCILLHGFDEEGDIVGNPRNIATLDSCTADHTRSLNGITETAIYNSILWKDSHEEFDRKYGNEKRMDIAIKLFPLHDKE